MTRFGRRLGVVALALAAAAAGYLLGGGRKAPESDGIASGAASDAPVTAESLLAQPLKDLSGDEHRLADWRGRLRVVNFWATWCPPCVTEIPAFVKLQEGLGEQGLQFIGVALDDPEPVRDFVRERGVNYPVLVGENDVMALMQGFGNAIGGLPYTVVIGPDDRMLLTHQGEWPLEDARDALTGLLRARTADEASP